MSTPKFGFCGYPVAGYLRVERRDAARPELWRPCGNIATPGCCYCDEHANAYVDDLPSNEVAASVPVTAPSIVERAAAREKTFARVRAAFRMALLFLFVVLLALFEPVHAWLHIHLQFIFGVLVGSVAEGIAWAAWRWRKGNRP